MWVDWFARDAQPAPGSPGRSVSGVRRSNELFIDGLPVPAGDRIGEEGKGFELILHGMNPERILIAAEAVGLGRAALARAARYAKERLVFGRPIGQNQAIQHPLAERWIEIDAAELMVLPRLRMTAARRPEPTPMPQNIAPPRSAFAPARPR